MMFCNMVYASVCLQCIKCKSSILCGTQNLTIDAEFLFFVGLRLRSLKTQDSDSRALISDSDYRNV